jgi:hypothetical protein
MEEQDQIPADGSMREHDPPRSQTQPPQQEREFASPQRQQQIRQAHKAPRIGPMKSLDTIDLLPRPVIADYIIQTYVSLVRRQRLRASSQCSSRNPSCSWTCPIAG